MELFLLFSLGLAGTIYGFYQAHKLDGDFAAKRQDLMNKLDRYDDLITQASFRSSPTETPAQINQTTIDKAVIFVGHNHHKQKWRNHEN